MSGDQQTRTEVILFQYDIVGSSRLEGPDALVHRTRTNYAENIKKKLSAANFKVVAPGGDGYLFAKKIKNILIDYDDAIKLFKEILHELKNFNSDNEKNLLKDSIFVRYSAHRCFVVGFDENVETIYADELNTFKKHERDFGSANSLSITEDLFSQIVDENIKEYFKPFDVELRGETAEGKTTEKRTAYRFDIDVYSTQKKASQVGIISTVALVIGLIASLITIYNFIENVRTTRFVKSLKIPPKYELYCTCKGDKTYCYETVEECFHFREDINAACDIREPIGPFSRGYTPYKNGNNEIRVWDSCLL